MDGLTIFRWVVAGLLGLVGVYLSAANWVILVQRFTRKDGPSWIPLLGGVLGAAALLVQPSPLLRSWWWTFFLIDGGSMAGLLTVPLGLLLARRNRGPRE